MLYNTTQYLSLITIFFDTGLIGILHSNVGPKNPYMLVRRNKLESGNLIPEDNFSEVHVNGVDGIELLNIIGSSSSFNTS